MIAATDHTSAFVSAAQAARALQPPRWLTLLAAVVLLLIGLSYHVKGQYLLVYGEHRSDAIDLRQKWTEQQYFLQRQNPFDVWIRYGPLAKTRTEPFRHATRNDTIDPRLGLGGAQRPGDARHPGLRLSHWRALRAGGGAAVRRRGPRDRRRGDDARSGAVRAGGDGVPGRRRMGG
jgi:hypothetical protein